MIVTIQPQQLQPSRRQVQQQLSWLPPHSVANSARSDVQPARRQTGAGGLVPADLAQQSVRCSRPAAASAADLTPDLLNDLLQQQPPASTGLSGAAAATASPLRKAASLPVSLVEDSPWMSRLRAAAAAGDQQQPATATATAAAVSDDPVMQQPPVVSAAAEQGAQLAAGRPSDVLHAQACGGSPCSMPPADADSPAAATQAVATHHSAHAASSPAASAGSQSCDVCRQQGLSGEAAWIHFKVWNRCPVSAGHDRLAWCCRYHVLSWQLLLRVCSAYYDDKVQGWQRVQSRQKGAKRPCKHQRHAASHCRARRTQRPACEQAAAWAASCASPAGWPRRWFWDGPGTTRPRSTGGGWPG